MVSVATPRPRVTVLGVGAMGRLHARVFAQLEDDFVLSGVYDSNRDRSEEIAGEWSVRSFATESEAILSADLVIVASPIEAHLGAARRALAGGRHLLVEKPLCATAAQAFALSRAVARGQRLFVGHSERFNPVVRALATLVRPADIRTLRLRRTAMTSHTVAEHGALVSLGVHDLDLAAHLTASPVALRDVLHVDDDRADLVLAASQGAVAWVHVDRRATCRERTLEVVTNDATYLGDLLARTLVVTPHGGAATPFPLRDHEALVAQARAVSRALRGSDEPLATGVDGARALALVEQAIVRRRARDVQAAAP